MRAFLYCGVLPLVLLGGCPQGAAPLPQATVTAHITISATSGPAPLTIYVTAAESSSLNDAIVSVQWDFAGQDQADTLDAVHTFEAPGRYTITLIVTNSADQQDITTVDVRVEGGPATAVIQTDVDSGPVPLSVLFDGTASGAEDDAILDYFWDFGDGETSRKESPRHIFQNPGTYTVQLRVVTFGGVEATASTTITAGSSSASLQFGGAQFATLPVNADAALSAFTFAAWFNADQGGGRLVSIGSPAVTLEILPTDGTVRVQQGGESFEGSAPGLSGWHRVTLTYDGTSGAIVEVDGLEAAAAALTGDVAVTDLILGNGFRGKISGVSFSGTVASDDQAEGDGDGSGGPTSESLGNWPLDEGSGQTLSNSVAAGSPGTLGASTEVESTDPAWSSDSP
jgi:PKD repeat protein